MKREERRIYNGLRKMDTAGLINVEVRHKYTAEARQAMHELLTIEKGLVAVRVCPSLLDYAPCTLYIPAKTREQCDARRMQETMTEAAVVETLPESIYTWNGYKKPGTDTDTDGRNVINETEAENMFGIYVFKETKDGTECLYKNVTNSVDDVNKAVKAYNDGKYAKRGYRIRVIENGQDVLPESIIDGVNGFKFFK